MHLWQNPRVCSAPSDSQIKKALSSLAAISALQDQIPGLNSGGSPVPGPELWPVTQLLLQWITLQERISSALCGFMIRKKEAFRKYA